jgi:soluble lytic murein transglycosylase
MSLSVIKHSPRGGGLKAAVLFLLALAVILAAVYYSVVFFMEFYRGYFGLSRAYDGIIAEKALRYGVDPCLVKALIWKESRFNRKAVGADNEIGLMQVMPGRNGAAQDWADNHRVRLPARGTFFTPEFNIEIGTWYLARALKRWRHFEHGMELALCEYNAGPGKASAWKPESFDGEVIERIGFKSTKTYVKEVMKRYRKYVEEKEFNVE